MSLPNSLHSYPEEIDAFDKALAQPHGIRILRQNEGKARYFIARLNKARMLQRYANQQALPPDHALHARTEWDTLACRLRKVDDQWWVYITPNPGEVLDYEVLDSTDLPEAPKLEGPAAVPQLTFRRV